MCGIAGLFVIERSRHESSPGETALRMVDTLAHRGPDGRGWWGDPAAGIGLGHRRLSIIDLSPTGAQPMHSGDGRYVITYNGEVYNFAELRAELETLGHTFRGTSDTEVMLASIVEWGLEKAVQSFAGMFAFALFDREMRTIHLARDRLGIKPLYWSALDGQLLFGSELRALASHPAFRGEVDREAVDALLRYSYVPSPATIYRGVYKLPPGTILSVAAAGEPKIEPYWRLRDALAQPKRSDISADEATQQLDKIMLEAVRQHMVADVPLGAFLSGGLDSSVVAALMQAGSNRAVRTFTIGFHEKDHDESSHARVVARHLGTDHTEVVLDAESALGLVQDIPDWFDEPFADSSQLPTYLVCRIARQHVTVTLSGDGGDELFGGYPKYTMLERLWTHAGHLPRGMRSLIATGLRRLPEPMLARTAALLIDPARAQRIGEKTVRMAAALDAPNADEAAAALSVVGLGGRGLVEGAQRSMTNGRLQGLADLLPDLRSRMQAQDMVSYLPDDILTKVDRCSMAASLESRVPLIDHRLIEFVWSLPADIRRGTKPKALLRSVLARYVPSVLFDRPKRGFTVPLDRWLSGPLREWADDLLSPDALARDGLFDIASVRDLWQQHLSGRRHNATTLWNILMMRTWSARWLKPRD